MSFWAAVGITVSIIIILFFYFIFVWGFRLIAVFTIMKMIDRLKAAGAEKLKEFQESMKGDQD